MTAYLSSSAYLSPSLFHPLRLPPSSFPSLLLPSSAYLPPPPT
jgi:hypothetical protein